MIFNGLLTDCFPSLLTDGGVILKCENEFFLENSQMILGSHWGTDFANRGELLCSQYVSIVRNFWAADIPAVMLTDTAFFCNKRYHEATDNPDPLDYKRMAACVLGLYEAVKECSGIVK